MEYNKPPLTYSQQIDLLKSRGLNIPDLPRAEKYLKHISYYRLSAYMIPFQATKDVFNDDVEFNHILDLYLFDRELRLLVLNAIERIEVSIRAQLIYQLAHKYGSHWQDNKKIFIPPYITKKGWHVDVFEETQKLITESCNAKFPEVFIKHYKDKYTSPVNPPSWMCVELITIGQLSKLFAALNTPKDQKDIAEYFGLHSKVFESWLHSIAYGRNVCAHHSRLWNREFAILPDVPRKKLTNNWYSVPLTNNRRCFFFMSILKYFLNTINPNGHFTQKLVDLITKYPGVPVQYLGIPSDGKGNLINWQNEPLWK